VTAKPYSVVIVCCKALGNWTVQPGGSIITLKRFNSLLTDRLRQRRVFLQKLNDTVRQLQHSGTELSIDTVLLHNKWHVLHWWHCYLTSRDHFNITQVQRVR